jgi:hypothetical protein
MSGPMCACVCGCGCVCAHKRTCVHTHAQRCVSVNIKHTHAQTPTQHPRTKNKNTHAQRCVSVNVNVRISFNFFSGTKALHVQVPAKTNLELPNAIARVEAPEESKAEHDRTPATAPLKTHRGRTEPGQHSGDHTNMMGTKGLTMAMTRATIMYTTAGGRPSAT